MSVEPRIGEYVTLNRGEWPIDPTIKSQMADIEARLWTMFTSCDEHGAQFVTNACTHIQKHPGIDCIQWLDDAQKWLTRTGWANSI